MSVTVRAPRPGDGAGMARVWLSAAAYYADLDPAHFQVPPAEGESFEASFGTGGEDELMLVADLDGQVLRLDTYAGSPVSVPFYERHMGYRRRAIVFGKPL